MKTSVQIADVCKSRRLPARRELRLVRGHGHPASFAARIKGELERLWKETAGFMIPLGLGAVKGAARAAAMESRYYVDQLPPLADIDPEYWRKFPAAIGARVRCLDAIESLAVLLKPGSAGACGYTELEWAAAIDRNLEVLHRETPKAADPPAPAVYRAWRKRQRIKDSIWKLEGELKTLEAR